jgi:hypothetical protein
MKEKFHTFHGQHSLDVASIRNLTIRFATQALACKLLRKCRKDQFPTLFIVAAERCVEGV